MIEDGICSQCWKGLRGFAGREVQRLGLSATIGNPEALLEWLAPASSRPRRIIAPDGRAVQSASVQLDYVGGVENTARVVSSLHKGRETPRLLR